MKAQNSELDNLKFLSVKGIELKTGTAIIDVFKGLKSKGCSPNELNDYMHQNRGIYVLDGSFNSIPGCRFTLLPLANDNKLLSTIGISLPNRDTFAQLMSDYERLKEGLKRKYHLAFCEEGFNDNYVSSSTSDYMKLHALQKDECKFKCNFYVSDSDFAILRGQVVLCISHIRIDYQDYQYVSVSYCTPDNINEQINSKDDL